MQCETDLLIFKNMTAKNILSLLANHRFTQKLFKPQVSKVVKRSVAILPSDVKKVRVYEMEICWEDFDRSYLYIVSKHYIES